jgi:hypothetical protein
MRRIFRGSFQAAQAVVPSLMAPAAPEVTDAASTPSNLAIFSSLHGAILRQNRNFNPN